MSNISPDKILWRKELRALLEENKTKHALKDKTVSTRTKDNRHEVLFQAFEELRNECEPKCKLDDPRHFHSVSRRVERDAAVKELRAVLEVEVIPDALGWLGAGDGHSAVPAALALGHHHCADAGRWAGKTRLHVRETIGRPRRPFGPACQCGDSREDGGGCGSHVQAAFDAGA